MLEKHPETKISTKTSRKLTENTSYCNHNQRSQVFQEMGKSGRTFQKRAATKGCKKTAAENSAAVKESRQFATYLGVGSIQSLSVF